jgi:GTPase Era involved in 16S rRNA processing
VGSLVIVDTPGPNETGKLKLEQVLRQQLESCSLVLLVLDYTQLNSEAAEKVKNDVDSFAQIKGLDSLYILVNKVDMRRSEHDMSPEEVIEFVRRKFNIKQDTDRVFEVSATRAAYVSNFMAELEQIEARGDVPEISELKTLKPLAMQAYGDFWQRRIKTLSIDQIKEDSQII